MLARETPSPRVIPLLLPSLDELLFHSWSLIAIDIPLGLPESGARLCDTLARKQLGRGRSSSIFPAPIRPLLPCATYQEACTLGRSIDGRAISKQTWNILEKIREADALLRTPQRSFQMHEVHPELSFTIWTQGAEIPSKKTEAGRLARLELVEKYIPGEYARVRAAVPRTACRDDDILDAFAALWTAERILADTALTLPAYPECDSEGIRKQISA